MVRRGQGPVSGISECDVMTAFQAVTPSNPPEEKQMILPQSLLLICSTSEFDTE